jgi:hypothetical protein
MNTLVLNLPLPSIIYTNYRILNFWKELYNVNIMIMEKLSKETLKKLQHGLTTSTTSAIEPFTSKPSNTLAIEPTSIILTTFAIENFEEFGIETCRILRNDKKLSRLILDSGFFTKISKEEITGHIF